MALRTSGSSSTARMAGLAMAAGRRLESRRNCTRALSAALRLVDDGADVSLRQEPFLQAELGKTRRNRLNMGDRRANPAGGLGRVASILRHRGEFGFDLPQSGPATLTDH